MDQKKVFELYDLELRGVYCIIIFLLIEYFELSATALLSEYSFFFQYFSVVISAEWI